MSERHQRELKISKISEDKAKHADELHNLEDARARDFERHTREREAARRLRGQEQERKPDLEAQLKQEGRKR